MIFYWREWEARIILAVVILNLLASLWIGKRINDMAALGEVVSFQSRLRDMGTARITAYSATEAETDNRPTETASGRLATTGICAVSQDYIKSGLLRLGEDMLHIEGLGTFSVDDTMNIRFGETVDILKTNPEEARKFGVRHARIYRIASMER